MQLAVMVSVWSPIVNIPTKPLASKLTEVLMYSRLRPTERSIMLQEYLILVIVSGVYRASKACVGSPQDIPSSNYSIRRKNESKLLFHYS